MREKNLEVLWISVALLGYPSRGHFCADKKSMEKRDISSLSNGACDPANTPAELGGNSLHCLLLFLTIEARCSSHDMRQKMLESI